MSSLDLHLGSRRKTRATNNSKAISLSSYASLSQDEKNLCYPIYSSYRTKKVRDYHECECCDHRQFLGWIEEKVPTGEVVEYRMRSGVGALTIADVTPQIVNTINDSTSLLDRIVSSNKPWGMKR